MAPAEIRARSHLVDFVWNFPLQVPLGIKGCCSVIGQSLKAGAYTSPEQGGCAFGRLCVAPPDTVALPHCQELFPVQICCPPVVVLALCSTLQRSLWRKRDFQLCKIRREAGSPKSAARGAQNRTLCVCVCACLYCKSLQIQTVFIVCYLSNHNDFFVFAFP